MGILIGLFVIGIIILLYNIFTTEIPEDSYFVKPKNNSIEKPIEEHFEDTLEAKDFVKKEDVIEVHDKVKEVLETRTPKKHLQKRERKTLKHIVKDK